jgi:hypothetical protein
MSAGPPPWQGQPVPPERTPDGRRIKRHPRFGAMVEDENGRWAVYVDEAEELRRIDGAIGRAERRPARPWSVWSA